MSGQRPAIPARLAARPADPRRGLPIPYVSEQDDGSVNFAVINGARVLECVREQLCGLCGQRQDFRVAFVGGFGEFRQRVCPPSTTPHPVRPTGGPLWSGRPADAQPRAPPAIPTR